MTDADAQAADNHQAPPAEAVDKRHRQQCEDKIDGAGDDNVEKNVIGAVAGAAIYLFGIVEKNIDATTLLQDGQTDANPEQGENPAVQHLRPADLFGTAGKRLLNSFELEL